MQAIIDNIITVMFLLSYELRDVLLFFLTHCNGWTVVPLLACFIFDFLDSLNTWMLISCERTIVAKPEEKYENNWISLSFSNL